MTNPFMEVISSGEGNYNSYNRGTYTDDHGENHIIASNGAINLSLMTINEIQRRQALPKSNADSIFAVGKYQLIPDTLDEAISKLRIGASEKFTPELQDRLFNEYILPKKRPVIQAYITGKEGTTLHDAQKATCMEWASVEDPDTPGHVFARYEKYGNKMHTTAAQVAAALDEMRIEYKTQIDKGLSADDAWRATTTMGLGQSQHIAQAHSTPHHTASSVLREGIHHPAVGELQANLNKLGYTDAQGRPLDVDNDFGRSTRSAVEAFQNNQGLNPDGIAGPNTWAALRKATQAQSLSDSPKAVPELDAPLIRTLQQHLIKPGSDTPQNPAAPPLSAEPVVTPPSHADDTNQQLAMLQAQLREMQRQMEAMNRERNAEREKDEARTAPSDVIQHDAQPSRQADNDHATVGYSDPRHPVHPLYADVKQRLEAQGQHLPEDRLTQVVGEMHMRKFQPNWDGYVKVQGDKLCAGDYHPWGGFVTLDLKQPAPPVQETLRQVDNHQQALAQEQMLRAQQTPSLGHGHALSR